MPQEIERKFIVKEIPENIVFLKSHKDAFQGYLSIDSNWEVRISNRLHLTTKTGSGLTREENITKISLEIFDMLWPLTLGHRIHKTRNIFEINGYIGELDIYHQENEGLIIVEVEFSTAEEAVNFSPPNWFGEDVTYNPEYKNASLAK